VAAVRAGLTTGHLVAFSPPPHPHPPCLRTPCSLRIDNARQTTYRQTLLRARTSLPYHLTFHATRAQPLPAALYRYLHAARYSTPLPQPTFPSTGATTARGARRRGDADDAGGMKAAVELVGWTAFALLLISRVIVSINATVGRTARFGATARTREHAARRT